MRAYSVIYSPEADADLADLYSYLAFEASPQIAYRYVGELLDICESLSHYPDRGLPRFDMRPGLRTLIHKRRVVIAYEVSAQVVTVLGIFTGGRDYASDL
jgi:toxin ParE1/3/4|tara:strand:+ start:1326 stop:1625 length:300 start_codon:yes stop_codon:yes gene_type:complete